MFVPVGIASPWTYRNLRQVHSSPIRAQPAARLRISSIRQLTTGKLRGQSRLQRNPPYRQLATDDLRLADSLKLMCTVTRKCVTSGVTFYQRLPAS